MRAFLQDLRYGVRTLTRTPGFTVIAIAVLALGIGANALVFSLANTVFLRPLPAADPGTVVRVYSNRFSNTRTRPISPCGIAIRPWPVWPRSRSDRSACASTATSSRRSARSSPATTFRCSA